MHKCQPVTQLNALLPSFKAVMIAYCRGELTGKAEKVKCVFEDKKRKNIAEKKQDKLVCVCALFDQPQQDQNFTELSSRFNLQKYH